VDEPLNRLAGDKSVRPPDLQVHLHKDADSRGTMPIALNAGRKPRPSDAAVGPVRLLPTLPDHQLLGGELRRERRPGISMPHGPCKRASRAGTRHRRGRMHDTASMRPGMWSLTYR
jgi:hypothetical protein